MLLCPGWGERLGRGRWRKKGRPRKPGKRHPSGKLVQLKKDLEDPDLVTRTARQPHRRLVRDADRKRVEAESTLGRYLLLGFLADVSWQPRPHCPLPRDVEAERARYEAGTLFARDVGAYHAIIAGPRMTLGLGHVLMGEQLPQGEMAESDLPRFSCNSCAPDPDLTEAECPCMGRRRRYTDATAAIALGFPGNSIAAARALRAVGRVAVWGHAIGLEQLVYLVRGLDALVEYYGLTRWHRSRYFQNTD
jgi:hypothetical protein